MQKTREENINFLNKDRLRTIDFSFRFLTPVAYWLEPRVGEAGLFLSYPLDPRGWKPLMVGLHLTPKFQGTLHTHFIQKWEIQGDVLSAWICKKKQLWSVYQHLTAKETMLNYSVYHLRPLCSTQLHFRAGNETTEGKVNLDLQVTTMGAAIIVF